MVVQPSGAKAKSFGAFYTDEAVADFLTHWAVRSADARVLDPSFGGGVFLQAAATVLGGLGGNPRHQVFGVEIDPSVQAVIAEELSQTHGIDPANLTLSDFFDVEPTSQPAFDAVIGNPPFIRYQSFSGSSRATALDRAGNQGVELTSLTSSWAPFLVHSSAMLRDGGNLAMVIPMELGHASYAQPVLEYLVRSFSTISVLTFRTPLFPELSQDTVLLLAEGKGGPFRSLGWQDLGGVDDLEALDRSLPDKQVLDHTSIVSGETRLRANFVDSRARALYQDLVGSSRTVRLGSLAQVGIGYVSGANDFFHLSPSMAEEWRLPASALRPAVFRGRDFSGLKYTVSDWVKSSQSGNSGYLAGFTTDDLADSNVRSYVSYGESIGVDQAYKCRTRRPWFQVPNVYLPDALLTYMSGRRPGLVANGASVVAPNTLHTVRMRESSPLNALDLAVAWQSSLVSLSVEIEGHAMGGGMLKLEPREAQRVAIPVLNSGNEGLAEEVDQLLRAGRIDDARHVVDREVLISGLGLTATECETLEVAAEELRERRHRRGRVA